jgi:hypothetical protein
MRKNFIPRLVEELQLDLVNGVREYNEERAHSGQVLLREKRRCRRSWMQRIWRRRRCWTA